MGGLATGFAKVSTRSAKAPRRKGARVSKSTLRVGDAVCMGGVAGLLLSLSGGQDNGQDVYA